MENNFTDNEKELIKAIGILSALNMQLYYFSLCGQTDVGTVVDLLNTASKGINQSLKHLGNYNFDGTEHIVKRINDPLPIKKG